MPDGLSIAAVSMTNDMQRLNSISQNLTNALTPGYKRELLVNAAFLNMVTAGGAFNTPLPATANMLDMRAGTLRFTGNPLDLAIENDGFFEVIQDGHTYYTRQGNFGVDASGRIVTPAGDTLNGMSGEIRLSSAQPAIDRQGRILENGKQVGQLRLVRFDDPRLLQAVGGGKFVQAGASVKADGAVTVRQAHLEAANVSTAAEMVKMIETMRHFETGQKIIQMYDDMNERAISKLGDF